MTVVSQVSYLFGWYSISAIGWHFALHFKSMASREGGRGIEKKHLKALMVLGQGLNALMVHFIKNVFLCPLVENVRIRAAMNLRHY